MIGSTRNLRVHVSTEPCDLRRGYDGLYAIARDVLSEDPLSGHLFLFVSRSRKRAKVLFFDGTGLCIYMKRLEVGLFSAPWKRGRGERMTLTMSELALFMEGSEQVLHASLSPKVFAPGRVFRLSDRSDPGFLK